MPLCFQRHLRKPTSSLPTHLPTYLEAEALVEAHCVVVVHLHRMAIQLSKREALQRPGLDWQHPHDPLNRKREGAAVGKFRSGLLCQMQRSVPTSSLAPTFLFPASPASTF